MRRGDNINGYAVITEPSNAGGGRCQWAFAKRDGLDFHIKEFLTPKYPLDSAPGSPARKAVRRKAADAFEARHRAIMDATQTVSVGGGNLIVAHDFFRAGSLYYKLTERVEAVPLPEPSQLNDKQRDVLVRTLGHSVEILHRHDIVHGDLKSTNFLVRPTERGLYSAKLIDFDDSYFVDAPPPADEIVGTPTHYSPELLRYVKAGEDADPSTLSCASDIFALGLIFHRMLAGEGGMRLPDRVYPCEIVARGERLPLSDELPDAYRDLIEQMLAADADDRPTAAQVLLRLPRTTSSGDGRRTAKDGTDGGSANPEPKPSSEGSVRANFGPRTSPSSGTRALRREPKPEPKPPRPAGGLRLGPGFRKP